MATSLTRVRVIGSSVGWTLPVLGPDGEQETWIIPGSGSRIRRPRWNHLRAERGAVLDLPAADVARLAGHVEVVDPATPVSFTPPPVRVGGVPSARKGSGWGVLVRIFTTNGAPAEAAPELPQIVQATDEPEAPATAPEPAQDGAQPQTGLVALKGGWYLQPDGAKVQMTKEEAASWAPPAGGE